jgi:hypothetical protein
MMKLKRADILFACMAVAVVIFLIILSTRFGSHPQRLPTDPAHSVSDRRDCLACHDPKISASLKPLTPSHPQKWKDEKFQCTNCHVRQT